MKIALAKGTCDLQCMIVLVRTGERASTNFYTGQCINQGYRMVFANICEQASSAIMFVSTSSDQFFLRAANTLENTYGEKQEL